MYEKYIFLASGPKYGGHYIHQDLQDKQSLAFIEFWEDEKSIEIHSQTPHFTTICPQINALCETEMTIHMYKEL